MPLLQLTKHSALYVAGQRGCQTPQSRLGRPGDAVIMTFCHPKWRFRKRKYIDVENFCAAPCAVCSHKDFFFLIQTSCCFGPLIMIIIILNFTSPYI